MLEQRVQLYKTENGIVTQKMSSRIENITPVEPHLETLGDAKGYIQNNIIFINAPKQSGSPFGHLHACLP